MPTICVDPGAAPVRAAPNGIGAEVAVRVLHENEQIFASRYKLVLPFEEELRAELERERIQLAGLIEDTRGGSS